MNVIELHAKLGELIEQGLGEKEVMTLVCHGSLEEREECSVEYVNVFDDGVRIG